MSQQLLKAMCCAMHINIVFSALSIQQANTLGPYFSDRSVDCLGDKVSRVASLSE